MADALDCQPFGNSLKFDADGRSFQGADEVGSMGGD